MKLLYGTGNPAKAAAMQNRIAGLGIELISLQDLQAQGWRSPMSRRQAIHLWRMPGRKLMLIMKLFVCLYFPVIPGCILKMSRSGPARGTCAYGERCISDG